MIKLIAEGLTSEEVGETLMIAKNTVDRHRDNILEKLGMRNRVDLTRYAIKRGLVEPQPWASPSELRKPLSASGSALCLSGSPLSCHPGVLRHEAQPRGDRPGSP